MSHLDEVDPGRLDLDIAEDRDTREVVSRALQGELVLLLGKLRRLIGADQADAFVELADAGGPAVEDEQPHHHDGQLRHGDAAQDAEQDEVAVHLTTDLVADQGALKIG